MMEQIISNPGLSFPNLAFEFHAEPLPPGLWLISSGVVWVGWQGETWMVEPQMVLRWMQRIMEGQADLNLVRMCLQKPERSLSFENELQVFGDLFQTRPTGLKAFLKKEKAPFHCENEALEALQKFCSVCQP